jgi:glycosyltransferase involved in cell wall biosynthesis
VYCNAPSLGELATRVCAASSDAGVSHELIFVIDGSPDSSAEEAQDIARSDPAVGVLVLAFNHGQHRALRAGLAHCRGRSVVIMDADLQDPPEVIPSLLAELGDGVEVVFAGRHGRYQRIDRMISSRLFKIVQSFVCGLPTDAGTYAALTEAAVFRLLEDDTPGHMTLPQQIGLLALKHRSLPIRRAVRARGRSAYSSAFRLTVALRSLTGSLRRRLAPGLARASATPSPAIASWDAPRGEPRSLGDRPVPAHGNGSRSSR